MIQSREARIAQSPQFQDDKAISHITQEKGSTPDTLPMLKKFFFQRGKNFSSDIPVYKAAKAALMTPAEDFRAMWLGHSMLSFEIDGLRVLIDPVFGAAAPQLFSGMMERASLSPVDRDELPLPDVIVISHDHYDHLEEDTVKYFAKKNVRFLVPLGVGKHLESWGVQAEQFEEFDWWQSTDIQGVEFTATPANHSSGRGILDQRSTLWASWVIKG